MNPNSSQFDIVISGGGLSGSLLALSLSQLTQADGRLLSIAIIESTPYSPSNTDKPSIALGAQPLFDDRVLALSHGSADYLKSVGVWPLLQGDACPIKTIDISDRGYFGKARLSANEYSVDALGYVIDMALIGKAQLQCLAQCPNVSWFSPDSIADIAWRHQGELSSDDTPKAALNNQVAITLSSGTILTSSLLLACDGAQSPCRQLAQIKVRESQYNQSAIIANVATEHFHHFKAFERFTEFGPIAMLPLPSLGNQQQGQGRCSLVWTLPPEQATRIAALEDNAFKIELERAFGSWLGSITQVGKRSVYPLTLLQAEQQIFHRMALVGNASHTIHPIAGQGFNLGLRDVKVLSELIAQAVASKQDIGAFGLLQQYQQNRISDQQQVINLTDSLVTLFSNTLTPCVIGRNIGLQALNLVSPLKNALVKKTMGY